MVFEILYTLIRRLIILPACLLSAGLSIHAQTHLSNIQFEHYGLEEGLSQTSVKHMVQDSKGFIWLGTQDGLNRFDGYEFVIFRHDPDDPYSLTDNNISSLYEDYTGRLWVGGQNGTLQYLDRSTARFHRFPDDPKFQHKIQGKQVRRVLLDHQGILWMLGDSLFASHDPNTGAFTDFSDKSERWYTHFLFEDSFHRLWVHNSSGLQCMDAKREQWNSFLQDISPAENWLKTFIFEDHLHHIWIGAGKNQLFELEPDTRQLTSHSFSLQEKQPLSGDYVMDMEEDRAGNLWAAFGKNGICRFDRPSQQFICYTHDPKDPGSLLRNTVWSLQCDNSDNLWVGTWAGGLSRMKNKQQRFVHIQADPAHDNGLSQEQVESFYEDEQGNLWIATTAGGLNRLHQPSGKWTHYRANDAHTSGIGADHITHLSGDAEGNIWISLFYEGIQRLDKLRTRFRTFKHDPQDPNSLSHNNSIAIYEDNQSRLWIGSHDGTLHLYEPDQQSFIRKSPGQANGFTDITIIREDKNGKLWLGSRFSGLACYDPETEAFRYFPHDPNNPQSISLSSVFYLHWDQQDRLWVGTSGGGLNLMKDEKNGTFKRYRQKDGLPNDVIYGILEDERGRLWLSTNKGISCFDPMQETFRNFGITDGLQNYEFNQRACYKSPYSGKMYFGGVNGYNVFHPDSIIADSSQSPVVFTSMTRYNPQESIKNSINDHFVADKELIELEAAEKILRFQFASLGFRQLDKIHYQYKLQGFSEAWQDLGNKRELTFTNLDPGDYVLRVKGSNSDGIWHESPTALNIRILPPWYLTAWAYGLYLIILGGLVYGGMRLVKRRRALQMELIEKQQTADRHKEIAEFKTSFYAHITHEFRTPLTVIQGLADQIKGHPKARALIHRNSQQLLLLVEQIMDLQQMEAQKMQLCWKQGDVMLYIRSCLESFETWAKQKQIELNIHCSPHQYIMDFDPAKLQQILNNLLSNALKFTPPQGQIKIVLYVGMLEQQPQLHIDISDSGEGIPQQYHELIFYPYRQIPETVGGTGLGLAWVKELTNLMGGSIALICEAETGCSFQLRFPVRRNAPLLQNVDSLKQVVDIAPHADVPTPLPLQSGRPSLLIAEDHEDLRYYFQQLLQPDYNVFMTKNGQEAWEKVREIRPDLIISDVMMPQKDGFELCQHLRQHPATQHIPIILLTAKTTQQDKLTGLSHAADAYICKPFDEEELKIRIRQLLQKDKIWIARSENPLRQHGLTPKTENEATRFMERLHRILNEHLQNETFKIKDLTHHMGMNHVTLNNKIKAYTSQTTAQYIRNYRLQLAQELLQNTDLSVVEISYRVGIPEASNFNNMFKKAVGKTPVQWRKG